MVGKKQQLYKLGYGEKSTYSKNPQTNEDYQEIADEWEREVTYMAGRYKAMRVVTTLRFGRCKTFAWYRRRAKELRKKYPRGFPMASRPGSFRCFIQTSDLVIMTGMSIRTAQRKIRELRNALGKGKGRTISVQEYCRLEKEDEEYILKWVNQIPMERSYTSGHRMFGEKYMNMEDEELSRRMKKDLEEFRQEKMKKEEKAKAEKNKKEKEEIYNKDEDEFTDWDGL
jgi:hypothetical protein